MYCPSCNGTIKYFSKVNFSFGRITTCPHCKERIKHSINIKYFLTGFIPMTLFHLKILSPILFEFGVPRAYPVGQFITFFVFMTLLHQFKLTDKPNKPL